MRVSRFLPLGLAGAVAACNGHDQLCDRKFSEVTMMGAHNSAFVGRGPSHNQYVSPTEQLELGIRFLQARTQDKSGHPQMCHSYCWLLDVGPLEEYLEEVASWMDDNPEEVVALLLTNNDGLPVGKFAEAFEHTGLEEHVFRPEGRLAKDEWPTLRELIDAGTRLIVFMDSGANTRTVDYILPEFDYYWETPFGETNAGFPRCDIDRPPNGDPERLMSIINHFLNIEIPFVGVKIPDQVRAPLTNSLRSITDQVELCRGMWGETANVVLLDWVNVGQVMRAERQINGL